MTYPDDRPSRRRLLGWIAAGAVALAAAGTAAALTLSGSEPERITAQPAAAPAGLASSTPSAPPTPSAAAKPAGSKAGGVLKLGQKYRYEKDGYVIDVTALKFRSGDGYEGVQVRTCNRADPISVSRDPWTLGYDNFEQLHNIDTTGGGLPAPAYEDRDLDAGDCTKGWINFTDVPGEEPDGIQYTPQDGEPIRWAF
jgi:hypothetical protein